MVWQLRLNAGLTVATEATNLGPPPNASVAVLLVLLVSRNGSSISRTELAATLYPDASRAEALNALRQSLFRLRRWLGEDCVETEGSQLRLAASQWTIVPNVLAGEALEGPLLAGIDHPALDSIRRTWSPSTRASLGATATAFVSVVKGLAEHDLDAARGVFIAGGPLLGQLGNDRLADLIRCTKPQNGNAPYALEHRERSALFLTQLAEFDRARKAFVDVYRLAGRAKNDVIRLRAAAYVACNAIEIGEMGDAEAWLAQLGQGRSRANLDLLNSQACYYWNAGEIERAISLMDESHRYLSSADNTSRFRYWINRAFLFAEAGRIDEATDAVALAAELGEPAGAERNTNLEIVRGLLWAARGEPYHAIEKLNRLLTHTRVAGYRVDTLYIEEALAGIYASVGNVREGNTLWASARSKRGGRQNARILAQQRRSRI